MQIVNPDPKMLTSKKQLGPYPMEKLKRVDKPTTKITDNIQRIDERQTGFSRALRGELGKIKVMDFALATRKDPLLSNLSTMLWCFPPVDVGETLKVPYNLFVPDKHELTPPPSDTSPMQVMLRGSKEKVPIPDDPAVMSRNIKSVGYFLGADIMGVCELPQWALYSCDDYGDKVECDHKYAISIVVDMGYRTMNGTTGYDYVSGCGPQWSYLNSAFIATLLAGYIRNLGYRARVNHSQNYQVLISPLLLLSGIGEMSRTGNILNPFLGLRFKASVVTTDLPLAPDMPIDFGLQDFCDKCMKCAVECPTRSISTGDKVMHNGYERWEFNADSCTKMRIGNPNGLGCNSCIKVCPWNKPKGWTHDLVRWSAAHMPFMNRAIIKMDDVCGYGKKDIRDRWQLDIP